MADDSVPLDVGVEQVAELFQNQRNRPFKGWSSRYLLKSDPGRYSDYAGGGGRDKLDVRPPRGWAWAHGDKGWEVDLTYTQCDLEGWTYATSFRDFTSSNLGLPAPAEHGTRVRRRRFIRRRVVIEDEHYDEDGSEDGGSAVSVFSRRGRSLGGGSASSRGSRGSRMQASRASVGFALAALEEQSSVKSVTVEVVIHGESFVLTAGPNDRVAWLQEEAMARFSREHNFATHVVQVVETYTQDIFQYTPEVGLGEEVDAGVQPLDPQSLVSEALSARDGKLIRPAPMEDGLGHGVPDVRVWGRLQATVVVPPGPLGVVLDGEIADRPVVLVVQGQAGPVTMTTPASTPPPASATATPSPPSTSRSTGPKVSRKDRMKRLLLGLAMKEFPQEMDGPERRPVGSGASPQPDTGGGGAAKGGFFGSTVGPSASREVSPSGRGRAVVSPLLSATDSATVRPGMLLTSVAARSGQGVSQDPVDTIGMGVKEAIETLVRYQHLHRSITFLDPPPGVTSGRGLDEGGGAASTGVTCPFAVSVTVVEAAGIKRSELFNADPFAWVRLGGTSQKTKVRKSTSRPLWDETFRFMVLSLERSMLVQLWDADEIGADVLLGEATVHLKSFPVNHPFMDDNLVLDSWYKLEGSSNAGNVRLKVRIDQQLRVAIHRKKVDSAARLLQGAMRSFVLRRQTVGRRKSGAPPLPPRSSRGSSFSAPGADAGEAVFAAADAAAAAVANVSQGQGAGGGNKATAGGKSGVSRKPSRKSMAGAVGGAWEASGAHSASTLADVFPAEDVDTDESSGRNGTFVPVKLSRESAVGVGRGTFGGGAANGVSPLVVKFLEGPGLERFGGGSLFRKNSTSTTGGRRSTLTCVGSDRRSSNSVRFLDDGRRSTVGGWGEHDEAARPGTSVCKDCLSDVASLLALAMTPARAAKTVMEDATHLRYPTSLAESPPPLAVAAFPAPRGGFGPLTVSSFAAFGSLCGENWADQAAPVLVAPSSDSAAAVAVAAGEVWEKASRGNGVANSSTGIAGGVVSGVLGGVVGTGGGSAAGVAPFVGKASVTVVLNGGGYISLIPGEEFQYWRWASALLLAVSGGPASMKGIGNVGEDSESFRGVVREVKTSFPGGNAEKIADSLCTLRSGAGKLSWSSTVRGQAYELPLSSAKGVVLSNAHTPACKFLFTVTVVSGCLEGITDSGASRFAVSEAEALSPGGGARICCLSHRVAYQDTQIGESFIPFASLTSGKDYTETLDISGNLRRLRLTLHSARGLVSSDVTGVTDPYCVVIPVRLDGTEVTSERGETSWQRSGLLRRDEWEETFELCRWCAPEEVKGIKIFIMDRDISRKDETLGEVFIPASMFKESKARRTKTSLRVNPPPPTSKKYSKNFGKYNVLGGRGSMSSASGSTSPKGTRDLGTLCVSMSVIEMDPSELARAGSGGLPPGGVKIRCSLDIADEFSCAWPALLLRHGSPSASGGGPAVDDEDDDDEDDSGGEAGTGVTEAGRVEKWRVSAGFGGLILSPVASGEGAAADSSPFIRIDPTGPADDFLMEVYENQRKRQPWGWGSGRKRHLKPSDPGRFSDSKGENRLHVKLLSQVEVPAGWAWSASEWSVAGRDCPSDKDGWTYGREPTFDALLRDSASGLSKEQKGTCVRRRRWVRPLYRTGVGRSPPRTGHRPGSSRAVPEATVDIPEGLIPFCRAQSDGSVVVLVHENQRYQPGAGWGSSDEDHLLPEDRAPLTGAAGIHPIDDLDDILPSSVGPAFQWEGEVDDHDEIGWNVGPWTYAEKFSDISMDLPRDAPGSDPGSSPKSPPLPPADRSAGVRSRVWWRVMVALEVGRGSIARGTSVSGRSSSRQSSAHLGQPARRKVAHAGGSGGGGSGGGTGGAQGDRVKIPLERLKRAAVVGPNTLIVEVDVEVSCTDKAWSVGDEWQPATLIIGPCDAPRLGSLLVERTATAKARAALGQVVRRARRLTAPPPLPPRPSAKRGDKGSSWAAGGSSGFYESPRGRSVRSDRWASSGNPAVNNNGPSSVSPRRALSHRHASNSRANTSPFGTDQTRDSSPLPQTPPGLASNSASNNPFVAADARGVSPHTRRPSESRSTSTSNNPFLPREGSTSPGTHSMITPAWSPGTSPGRARRGEVPLLEHVVSEAVDLLQNTGRAVAALDDAYNAAYNASAATDGWGAGGHDAAELGEAVLWTLWSRLVRLQAYLRQLLADTPAQDLKLPAAAKRGDWGVLAEHIDAEAAKQRSEIVAEAPEGTRRDSTHRADEDGVEVEARDVGEGSNMEGSMRAVEGLCGALDRRVSEMLLCADTFPESMLRQAVQVLATQCYTKVADEVGRHVTFRYEGLLPLADQQLLVLLDILVNKADIIERTLQPRLDLVGWRAVPPPLLTKAISVPWLLGAYATSIESKLSGLFRNILETNQEAMEFPPEVPEGSEQNEGSSGSKSPLHRRMKRGIVGGGGSRSKDQGASAQPQGFTMWTLHESTEKPLSVVPTTAMTLLDTYVVTVARRFPDDAGVQAVILRAGASALGSLRNIISAHTEASVTSCPERGWDKLLRFLCATANDCWQLVAESVPSIEERHPRAMAEGAEEAYETLKQLWMVLGVSCCRKAARLVLGFMATDELFVLEGMHEVGAEQSLVEIREALEYYCFNFLRPWLQEYFYHKVLVRMCDHIVVWAVQGLVRAAVARRPPLDQGQLLRLRACRDTLSGTLEACSQREASAPDGPGEGGGMYERRLGFLDDIIELLTVPQDELEGVFTGMLQRHIHCQRSVQHALQVVLSLRADGATVPESVSKWADEANWMGGDAVVLSSDTAEIEPFHRVFRRPLSALRADPAPLVAPTVLAQASDAHRRPLPTFGESVSTDEGVAKEGRGGGGGGKGPGGAGGPIGWSTRALGLTGGPSFGAAITGIARNAGGRSSTGSGSGRRRGMRDVMAKFRKGAKSKTNSGELLATTAPGSEAVVMEGVGVTSAEPVTLLQVMILEAEGLRNVAVLRKTDSYVTAHLSSRTGAREARTSVKKNTCHPKWSEPISFRVPSDSLVDIQFHLRVMGKQKLREDICLGHVELPLAGIGKAGDGGGAHGGKWFPLEEGQGKLRIDAELVTRRPSLVV